MEQWDASEHLYDIAVVGMAGRFPGAANVDEFWNNLRNGVEGITFFNDDELRDAGVEAHLLDDPNYVKAGAILDDADLFDASFFGFNPREAELMDPQQRVFLEETWTALEHAGYAAEHFSGAIGLFAGVGMNGYLLFNLMSNREMLESIGGYQTMLANDKDFLATRAAYKLDLSGPSVTVQTACSTSLVAVHLACQSLLNGESDLTLAGGVSIKIPQVAGYKYQEGGIWSPDGHCRAFDADAAGCISGSGAGIVVLKRMEDAVADRDTIHAVIKGSAVNNDGAHKVGYTAPSVDGQAAVIAEALALADIHPETIEYVEAHGTGTPIGDPIEIAALTQAYRAQTDRRQHCAIGSVKTNVGHLDAAAGVTGLIKTILALKHRMIPPSLHFEEPNPEIDFESSPFYVASDLLPWERKNGPRRAGVSSFGIGGTNAHVVLEEAPAREREPADPSRPYHVLTLSAKTKTALETKTQQLADYLERRDTPLDNVTYTQHVGRTQFAHRRMLVCADRADAKRALQIRDPRRISTAQEETRERPVVFMFSGQGAQHANMMRGLYETEPTFRHHVDHCADTLRPSLGGDLRDLLYPSEENVDEATEQLAQTRFTQPALFTVEYALAQLWMEWGVTPYALIGHSIGEYVAACLAGVFALDDALHLVARRGRLMQELPAGDMLSVSLPEENVTPLLNDSLSLAVINHPSNCVVSGPAEAITDIEQTLQQQGIGCRRLHTSHAFHSQMMDPMLSDFAEQVAGVTRNPPQLPLLSNVTGTWMTADQAIDPSYWTTHIRQTVRFAAALSKVLQEDDVVLLEVGPGTTLQTLARRHPDSTRNQAIIASTPHPNDTTPDGAAIREAVGELWLAGIPLDWDNFHAQERSRRVSLPTYPFDRERYWIEPRERPAASDTTAAIAERKLALEDWFWTPSWERSPFVSRNGAVRDDRVWLIFFDENTVSRKIVERLRDAGQVVFTVTAGDAFTQHDARTFTIDPMQPAHYADMLNTVARTERLPENIVHAWSLSSERRSFDVAQARGFYSVLALVKAVGARDDLGDIALNVLTAGVHDVTGTESLQPEVATLHGLCTVIPQEYPNITCRTLDIKPVGVEQVRPELVEQVYADVLHRSNDTTVAYRGRHRWIQTFHSVSIDEPNRPSRLRHNGVYVIVGGLGRIGLTFAERLARTVQAKLVLVGRSRLPTRDRWNAWLDQHPAEHPTSAKIQAIQHLEASGAEVLVASADVADQGEVEELFRRTVERFGTLDGVVHAAGVANDDALRSLMETTHDDCRRQFYAKCAGVYALAAALDEYSPDFCLVTSSLASTLGGLGFGAYAAANRFMDAFTLHQNRTSPTSWLSVNWDGWRFDDSDESALGEIGITPDEGSEVFERICSLDGIEQICVSMRDLPARYERWIVRTGPEPASAPKQGTQHSRPDLDSEYVAPRNETEEIIVEIWQDLLGIAEIGVYDNFFELGGHSLLATQVHSRLREHFGVELPLNTIFEAPTVADLAVVIVQHSAARIDDTLLDDVLDELETLSDDEVRELLTTEDYS